MGLCYSGPSTEDLFLHLAATKDHFSKWFLMNIITLRKMKQFLPYSLQSADILFSSRHRQIIFVFSYYLCREFSGIFCPRF